MGLWRKLSRSSLMHFILLGLLVFAGRNMLESDGIEISLDPARIAVLERRWVTENSDELSPRERSALLRDAVDEEILFREALRHGLDKLPVVRRRLLLLADFLMLGREETTPAEKYRWAVEMNLLETDLLARRYMVASMRERLRSEERTEPSDAEMEAFLDAHRSEYMLPRRIRLSHVFIGGHEPRSEATAGDLLEKIRRSRLSPEEAVSLGDPFYGGQHLPLKSEAQIARVMGEAFASGAIDLPEAGWSSPVHSAYGWHLVWIHDIHEAAAQPLSAVRAKILRRMMSEREDAQLAEAIEQLRRRYRVRVDERGGGQVG